MGECESCGAGKGADGEVCAAKRVEFFGDLCVFEEYPGVDFPGKVDEGWAREGFGEVVVGMPVGEGEGGGSSSSPQEMPDCIPPGEGGVCICWVFPPGDIFSSTCSNQPFFSNPNSLTHHLTHHSTAIWRGRTTTDQKRAQDTQPPHGAPHAPRLWRLCNCLHARRARIARAIDHPHDHGLCLVVDMMGEQQMRDAVL